MRKRSTFCSCSRCGENRFEIYGATGGCLNCAYNDEGYGTFPFESPLMREIYREVDREMAKIEARF